MKSITAEHCHELAANSFKSNDLIQSLNDQPVKTVADLLRLQNAEAGKRLEIRLVRAQTPNLIAVDHYAFAITESADADGFKTIPLATTKDMLPIAELTTQPATNNEPPQTLFDGKLDRNYGPVFGAEQFQATSIRTSTNLPLGQFRWLVWQVHSITPIGENTSFQEVQVIAP